MKIISTFVCSFLEIKSVFCEMNVGKHCFAWKSNLINTFSTNYFSKSVCMNWMNSRVFWTQNPVSTYTNLIIQMIYQILKIFFTSLFWIVFFWDLFAIFRDFIFVQKCQMTIFVFYPLCGLQKIRLIKWFYFIDQFFNVHVFTFNSIFF